MNIGANNTINDNNYYNNVLDGVKSKTMLVVMDLDSYEPS